MRFSTVLAILAPASAALAAQWNVTVGNNGTLTYDPTNLTGVATGDTVVFFFAAKNHTVTQSSFAAPCTWLGDTAADSGFEPVDTTTVTTDVFPGNNSAIPTFTYNVTNTSVPLWFYCAQTNPVSHCESGMVFAINPTANKTFDAFQQAAKALNTTASNSTGTNSTGTNSTATASGSSSSSSSTAPPSNSSSPADTLRVGAAGALLGSVGFLALVL